MKFLGNCYTGADGSRCVGDIAQANYWSWNGSISFREL